MSKKNIDRRGKIESEHDKTLIAEMQKLLSKETSNSILPDDQIAEHLLNQGLLCNAGRIFKLRQKAGIPNERERKIIRFAEEHKAKQKKSK